MVNIKIKIKTKVNHKIIKARIQTLIINIFEKNGEPQEIVQSRMSFEIFLKESHMTVH